MASRSLWKYGAVFAADPRTLVPIQTEPFQAVVDDLHGFHGVAGLVGVLDAQDELASRVPGRKAS